MRNEKISKKIFLLCVFFTVGACSEEPSSPNTSTDQFLDDNSASRPSSPNTSTDQFLIDNSARENVVVTDSGLHYEVLRASNGPMPRADSTITVNYVGELIDGTEFDSSYARGEPSTFNLAGTIPGWIEGVQLMNVGSQFRFVIPANLAYGDRGAAPAIAPNSILIFEIDLLEINVM